MRVSYAQLLAAADSMVAGVEGPLKLPPEHAASLLQLAMNCSDPGTATAAARRLPEQLEPELARKLLLTATTRQHTAVLMRSNYEARNSWRSTSGYVGLAEMLSDLPAAYDLSSKEFAQRMLAVVHQGDTVTVHSLSYFPDARGVPHQQLLKLLTTAVEEPRWVSRGATIELCEPLAAYDISEEEAAGLLLAALRQGKYRVLDALCNLPAAQRLSCGSVLQLLDASTKISNKKYVVLEGGRSAELARARKLGNGSLVLCLAGHPSCIIVLFRLLVKLEAVQLSVQQTAEALKVAALWSCEDAVTRLCALPAAGFLSSKQLRLRRL
uniref:Uncharacterized protein n=1 Tax=Tetradesmus obliquus TaxID=3088 RepID=A0A383W5Q2_TETOB|eukprot:jgi/Sobl393_1/3353/SZX72469.1